MVGDGWNWLRIRNLCRIMDAEMKFIRTIAGYIY